MMQRVALVCQRQLHDPYNVISYSDHRKRRLLSGHFIQNAEYILLQQVISQFVNYVSFWYKHDDVVGDHDNSVYTIVIVITCVRTYHNTPAFSIDHA